MNSTFGAKGTARRLAFLAAMLGLLSTGMPTNAAPPQDPPRASAAGSRLGTQGST
jgi:hypothetical protein